MTTQREIILRDLLARPEGVCASRWLRAYMPRYAARIYELRQEGHLIERERCREPHGHQTAQWKYVLVGRLQGSLPGVLVDHEMQKGES